MQNRGKLVVIYGINNLGKTTQAKLLVERLQKEGKTAVYIKYPVYDEDPSGMVINDYLRNGNPYGLTAREAQIFYAFNRSQFQLKLLELLSQNDFVVAEDYRSTGIAWGLGAGVEKEFLEQINAFCLAEDLILYLKGERFIESTESGHTHESDAEFMARMKQVFDTLAEEQKWLTINANQSIEEVGDAVWQIVKAKYL